jgi:hypothetical protein
MANVSYIFFVDKRFEIFNLDLIRNMADIMLKPRRISLHQLSPEGRIGEMGNGRRGKTNSTTSSGGSRNLIISSKN